MPGLCFRGFSDLMIGASIARTTYNTRTRSSPAQCVRTRTRIAVATPARRVFCTTGRHIPPGEHKAYPTARTRTVARARSVYIRAGGTRRTLRIRLAAAINVFKRYRGWRAFRSRKRVRGRSGVRPGDSFWERRRR